LAGSGGSSRLRLPSPTRRSTADTVESAIDSTSAISAAVIRSRRSLTIASTRRREVRCGIRSGADERSTRPASPSARQRASHLAAVRSLTPAASAASASDHPACTRSTINRRLFGQVLALACSFIRCPSLGLVALDTSSLQGGPDEQRG
jgi:hypothetical protein